MVLLVQFQSVRKQNTKDLIPLVQFEDILLLDTYCTSNEGVNAKAAICFCCSSWSVNLECLKVKSHDTNI